LEILERRIAMMFRGLNNAAVVHLCFVPPEKWGQNPFEFAIEFI
jgi:hypothetical protein